MLNTTFKKSLDLFKPLDGDMSVSVLFRLDGGWVACTHTIVCCGVSGSVFNYAIRPAE